MWIALPGDQIVPGIILVACNVAGFVLLNDLVQCRIVLFLGCLYQHPPQHAVVVVLNNRIVLLQPVNGLVEGRV